MTPDSEPKHWLQSKTIIGSAIAVLGVIARLLGYEIAESDQAALVDLVATLTTIAGSGLAIWGRVVASKPIGRPSGRGLDGQA